MKRHHDSISDLIESVNESSSNPHFAVDMQADPNLRRPLIKSDELKEVQEQFLDLKTGPNVTTFFQGSNSSGKTSIISYDDTHLPHVQTTNETTATDDWVKVDGTDKPFESAEENRWDIRRDKSNMNGQNFYRRLSGSNAKSEDANLVFEQELGFSLSLMDLDRHTDDDYWWFREQQIKQETANLHSGSLFWQYGFCCLLIAACSSLMATGVSKIVALVWKFEEHIYHTDSLDSNTRLWILVAMKGSFALLAAIITLCFAPNCRGSGVPELRAILNGVWVRKYLKRSTLFVKFIAVTSVMCSGLPIGLEGPFIHLVSIVGRTMTRIPIFQYLDRKRIIFASCASAVTVIFGTPLAGWMFACELTRNLGSVVDFWTAFSTCIMGSTLRALLAFVRPSELRFIQKSLQAETLREPEYGVVFLVALFCGLCGASYAKFLKFFRTIQNRSRISPYIMVVINVISFTVATYFIGDFVFRPSRLAIVDLFGPTPLRDCSIEKSDDCNITDWGENVEDVCFNLIIFIVVNLVFSITSLCLPYPCGIFGPTYAIGAGMGRLFGKFCNLIDAQGSYIGGSAGAYAMIGASALAAAVTRTFSTALITIEITAEMTLAPPILFAVMIAVYTSAALGPGVFDAMLDMKGIPLLPMEPRQAVNVGVDPPRPIVAKDVMKPRVACTYFNQLETPSRILRLLKDNTDLFFPIVDEHRHVVGEISRRVIRQRLQKASDPVLETIDLLNDRLLSDHVNFTPTIISPMLSLTKIYKLFHVLRPYKLYVAKRNVFMGIISESRLIDRERKLKNRPLLGEGLRDGFINLRPSSTRTR